jgi:putative membrane protein
MSKVKVSIIVIILFHLVGLVGFMVPSLRPLFKQLVPFHLLLMLGVVVYNHYRITEQFLLFAVLVFVFGIVAEWIGVHKHWIFGDYGYGKTLGTKVLDIPLTIGINWFVLVYATGVSLQRSRIISKPARVLLGAGMLVVLDMLIEPVAIRFDYWHWAGGVVPFKNYISWFGLSALFLIVFEQFKFKVQSIVAPILLLVQFVFFAMLQWV